ncbi:MAG: AAA family ATPase [Rhodospirillaceae bacterium]
MLKMALTRFTGSLTEAATRYAAEASPQLLVVETGNDQERILTDLEALADVCVAGTNLILMGEINDVGLYRSLTKGGVADYLVLPSSPVRLIEAVLELYQDANKRPVGQVIAFIGAKGGCGSSTLAANVAVQLAEHGNADVVVLDLDLPFGGADLAFNIETTYGVQSILSDPERVDDTFLQRFGAKHGDHLYLLAAPGTLEFDAMISVTALDATLAALRQQAKYVVLDLPKLWCEWVRQVVHTADQVVITAMPDLVSVRNTRNIVDFLASRRALDQPPMLVLNRVGATRRGEVETKDFGGTVGLTPSFVIGEDTILFGQAAAIGKTLGEINNRSKAAEVIKLLAAKLAGPVALPPRRSAPAISAIAMAWLHRLTGKG